MLFFFNDTATTESYTNLHTLSLHVAPPIWTKKATAVARRAARRTHGTLMQRGRLSLPAIRHHDAADELVARAALLHEGSEEHTSELQSLMRISYAAFGLEKKTR